MMMDRQQPLPMRRGGSVASTPPATTTTMTTTSALRARRRRLSSSDSDDADYSGLRGTTAVARRGGPGAAAAWVPTAQPTEDVGAALHAERQKFQERIAQIQEARRLERERWTEASEAAIEEASRVAAAESSQVAEEAAEAADAAEAESARLRVELDALQRRLVHAESRLETSRASDESAQTLDEFARDLSLSQQESKTWIASATVAESKASIASEKAAKLERELAEATARIDVLEEEGTAARLASARASAIAEAARAKLDAEEERSAAIEKRLQAANAQLVVRPGAQARKVAELEESVQQWQSNANEAEERVQHHSEEVATMEREVTGLRTELRARDEQLSSSAELQEQLRASVTVAERQRDAALAEATAREEELRSRIRSLQKDLEDTRTQQIASVKLEQQVRNKLSAEISKQEAQAREIAQFGEIAAVLRLRAVAAEEDAAATKELLAALEDDAEDDAAALAQAQEELRRTRTDQQTVEKERSSGVQLRKDLALLSQKLTATRSELKQCAEARDAAQAKLATLQSEDTWSMEDMLELKLGHTSELDELTRKCADLERHLATARKMKSTSWSTDARFAPFLTPPPLRPSTDPVLYTPPHVPQNVYTAPLGTRSDPKPDPAPQLQVKTKLELPPLNRQQQRDPISVTVQKNAAHAMDEHSAHAVPYETEFVWVEPKVPFARPPEPEPEPEPKTGLRSHQSPVDAVKRLATADAHKSSIEIAELQERASGLEMELRTSQGTVVQLEAELQASRDSVGQLEKRIAAAQKMAAAAAQENATAKAAAEREATALSTQFWVLPRQPFLTPTPLREASAAVNYSPPTMVSNLYAPATSEPEAVPQPQPEAESQCEDISMAQLLHQAAESARDGVTVELHSARQTIKQLEAQLSEAQSESRDAAERARLLGQAGQEEAAMLAHELKVCREDTLRLESEAEVAEKHHERELSELQARVTAAQDEAKLNAGRLVEMQSADAENAQLIAQQETTIAEMRFNCEKAEDVSSKSAQSVAALECQLNSTRTGFRALEKQLERMKEEATQREGKENAREMEAEQTRAALLAMRER